MGREIPNPPEDPAKNLVCLLNFLMPPFQLGNQPGDADRFDAKGNLKIVKEEPVSSSYETEQESDEVEIAKFIQSQVQESRKACQKPGNNQKKRVTEIPNRRKMRMKNRSKKNPFQAPREVLTSLSQMTQLTLVSSLVT